MSSIAPSILSGSVIQNRQVWSLLFAAWAVALVSTFGALFISEVMGQTPCLLCWYQRIFMFPLAIVFGVACYASDPASWRYALPLAAIG
ncbi:MAG: disulfide bond formation protein B [Hyphomicrobiales bacterium]|nr:disulfide bond formation protein B [Hyphomicrobiales bacterium]